MPPLRPPTEADANIPPRCLQAEKERREEQAREGRRIPKGQTPLEPYKTIEARDVGWSIIDSDFSKDKVPLPVALTTRSTLYYWTTTIDVGVRDVDWSIIDSDFSKDKVMMRLTRPQAVLLRTGLEPIGRIAFLWLAETPQVAAFVLSVSVCLPASASWRTRRGRGTCTWPASTRRPTSTR